MNEIELRAEYVRKMRKKFDQTWSEIVPKITIYGLVDETVGQMMKKRRGDKLVSVIAIAGAAWLFNSLQVPRNIIKFSKSKTPTLKQETRDHESSNPISRHG